MNLLPADSALPTENRARLRAVLPPGSLAVVNANDVLPTNADGTLLLHPNSDLLYLAGVSQEESILLLAPSATDETLREVLFLREPNPLLKTWEGYKLSREDAQKVSGIGTIKWLGDFPAVFHKLMCEAESVFLNANEHPRAVVEVETRDARFVRRTREQYPLHDYRRLAPLLYRLRAVKSPRELDLLRAAADLTAKGYARVTAFLRPGVNEREIEAEFAHEFIRGGGRFTPNPIIAAGPNSCVLHYHGNDQPCRDGDVLLLDVAASYANYHADVTRTLPVGGRFTPRQKEIYHAVLRVLRASIAGAVVGKLHRDWQREAQAMMNDELLALGLLQPADIEKQTPAEPACHRYFMHGLGHSLGLDVHDVCDLREPFAPGWVLTVEPGIYLPDEGFGIRLEDDVLVTADGPVNLTAAIPVEPDEVEALVGQHASLSR